MAGAHGDSMNAGRMARLTSRTATRVLAVGRLDVPGGWILIRLAGGVLAVLLSPRGRHNSDMRVETCYSCPGARHDARRQPAIRRSRW
jgi:hypothetical protein